jgi:type II secretory pathway component PulK|tara:strand:+ start:57 stop:464 length:408 start_codon:yes stop_codon:yes gene_type:complete
MKTKGFALILTLVVATVISTSAILIYTMTRDEMQIAANNRRVLQSKLAAVSGLTHFKSMELFYEHLRQQADALGREKIIVIEETALGDRTFYRVEVNLCCGLGENEFMVKSTGYYKDNGRIISEHVKRSLFRTVD